MCDRHRLRASLESTNDTTVFLVAEIEQTVAIYLMIRCSPVCQIANQNHLADQNHLQMPSTRDQRRSGNKVLTARVNYIGYLPMKCDSPMIDFSLN